MSDLRIQVDTIVNTEGNAGPTFPLGVQTDGLIVTTNLRVTGVITTPHANVQSIQATNVTATSFVGDGSGLTGTPSLTMSKAYALKCIISDPPLRS